MYDGCAFTCISPPPAVWQAKRLKTDAVSRSVTALGLSDQLSLTTRAAIDQICDIAVTSRSGGKVKALSRILPRGVLQAKPDQGLQPFTRTSHQYMVKVRIALDTLPRGPAGLVHADAPQSVFDGHERSSTRVLQTAQLHGCIHEVRTSLTRFERLLHFHCRQSFARAVV